MKMVVTEMEFKNIRKLSLLKISFSNSNGNVYKNSFIMMGNGTGKTTALTLIRGLFDGTAETWNSDKIRSFKPQEGEADKGEFSIVTKFDERIYKYFLKLDYSNGTAKISCTTAVHGGHETSRRFPDSVKDLFTKEFVRRFVFDGEQAPKALDNESNEAEEAIKYLYRLDAVDEIIKMNERILRQIQDSEDGAAGTDQSVSNLRSRKSKVDKNITRLEERIQEINSLIDAETIEMGRIEAQVKEIDKKFEVLNNEKTAVIETRASIRGEMNECISKIVSNIKSPYLVNNVLCERMKTLGENMTRLKLPKTISKDFFKELAEETTCICGRDIRNEEKVAILENAERYLGSDQQSVLNNIKSNLIGCEYNDTMYTLFESLDDLDVKAKKAEDNYADIEDKLTKAGGEEAERLRNDLKAINEHIGELKGEKKSIESKDDTDPNLNEDNNLHHAKKESGRLENEIAKATRTNEALKKKKIIEYLLNKIRIESTVRLKTDIIAKTNAKLRNVIKDDVIEIETIDRFIHLKGKTGASEGQTLSIAYCFLGTMFEEAELEFPFIIDSPCGKMDFAKRRAVAEILPKMFNQMISFVMSAEVEQFADQFYTLDNTQFITVIAEANQEEVKVHTGIDYFDTYQRTHKEDE